MVSVLEGTPSVAELDNLEIAKDQVSDQQEVDEDNEADVMDSVLEGTPSVAELDNEEIAKDQVSDQLEVYEDNNANVMVSVLEGIPSVAELDNLEIATDQVSDQLEVDEDHNTDVMDSVLEGIPSVIVLDNLEITTDQVSDQLEVEEESLLATGSVESLKRALDQLEMENGTDPTFSQLEGYQGFLCESMTVECCIPSFLNENARDQVSCRLEVDEESLVDTGSIESLTAGFEEIEDTAEPGTSYVFETKSVEPTRPFLFSETMQNTTEQVLCQFEVDGESLVETGSIESFTAGFDEIEDTAEPGSSCFIEPKTLEPNTPCLFSKEIVNTTEPGPSLAAVDEESLNEIISVDTYTCCAVEMRTEDDMVKGSDSMNEKARLKEQIKVLQQQLYEVSISFLSFFII